MGGSATTEVGARPMATVYYYTRPTAASPTPYGTFLKDYRSAYEVWPSLMIPGLVAAWFAATVAVLAGSSILAAVLPSRWFEVTPTNI